MATYYIQIEEEAWKCPKHPSVNKRRRQHYNGVCPTCLRDRLVGLCHDKTTSSSSSSNNSSSSSSNSSSSSSTEPSLLRRSRSLVAKTPSFLFALKRSTRRTAETEVNTQVVVDREAVEDEDHETVICHDERIEEFARMITRSRSVGTGMTMMASGFGRADVSASSSSRVRTKSSSSLSSFFRSFPSPMRLFRSSKSKRTKVVV